ncbi:MAG: DUF982 domain-containing protein [Rhizobiaceae bacterium]|nr:DUF982 domain-containing protein [Rhizobiaceae bacterium]
MAAGGRKRAGTVSELRSILLHYWPVTEGPAFINALVTCQEVLDGSKPAEKAREAFLWAASEAEIAVSEG